jgi:uncharacterized protein
MGITDAQWESIRNLFNDAFNSCFHYAFATVNEDGSPHVTPIGSLILRNNRTGFYFDEYVKNMTRNFDHSKRVCVMAVNSNKWFGWKSFFLGRFVSPPAVRLIGTVGERREATQEELKLFQERISKYKLFKGYDLLWSKLRYVRDVHFDSFEPAHAGVMTRGLWKE